MTFFVPCCLVFSYVVWHMKMNSCIMQNYTRLQCNALSWYVGYIWICTKMCQLQFLIWNIPSFHKHLQLCDIFHLICMSVLMFFMLFNKSIPHVIARPLTRTERDASIIRSGVRSVLNKAKDVGVLWLVFHDVIHYQILWTKKTDNF